MTQTVETLSIESEPAAPNSAAPHAFEPEVIGDAGQDAERSQIDESPHEINDETRQLLLYSLKLRDPDAFKEAFNKLTPQEKGRFDAFEAHEDSLIKQNVPQASHLIGKLAADGEHFIFPSSKEGEISDNDRLLATASEGSRQLVPYYKLAVQEHPEIAGTKLIRIGDDELPSAQPDFQHGEHEVEINLSDNAHEFYAQKLEGTTVLRIIAEITGHSEAELLDPQRNLLAPFVFAHELGHIVQYQQFMPDPDQFRRERNAAWNAFPVPGVWPSRLENALDTSGVERSAEQAKITDWVAANWRTLRAKYGITTTQELVALQQEAHRRAFSERFADEFAADLLRKAEANLSEK